MPTSPLPPRSVCRSTRLRVLLVMDTCNWAGTESYVQTLALALRENGEGAEVSVAAPPGSILRARARAAGLPVVNIARLHAWGPDTLQTLTRRLRRGATDVIHAHNGRTALFGSLAVRLAGRGAAVLTHHFIAPAHSLNSGALGQIKGAAHGQMSKGIALHIAISGAVAEALIERGEVAARDISIVRNGIAAPCDGDGGAMDAPLPPALRAEIACIARLEKEKDLPTLVRAMKILRDEWQTQGRGAMLPRCVVAGEGFEREGLEALIRAENVGDGVHLAGFTPLARQIQSAAQVCVLPSFAEPFGLALLEAMAQKRAVVAVDAGGPREIVIQNQTGLLVPPHDARAMASAMGALLDDPARARAMGEAGYERFQSHFTSARMARETLSVYRRALAAPSDTSS